MFKHLGPAVEGVLFKTEKKVNKKDILIKVKKIVSEHLGVEESKISEKSHFVEDLGADSLEMTELHMAFEEKFGIKVSNDEAEKLMTVGSVVNHIVNHHNDKSANETIYLSGDYGDEKSAGYADPGYQKDKKPRYPTKRDGEYDEERIRAAWNYIHKAKNRKPYTEEQLKHIEDVIISAWKIAIDKDGPPSAKKD